MVSWIKRVLFIFIVVLLGNSSVFSEEAADIDYGEISEISHSSQLIQVHDRIHQVGVVEVLENQNEPVSGSFDDLQVGDIVKVVMGTEKEGYREAKLVTLYSGSAEKSIRNEMEILPNPIRGISSKSIPPQQSPKKETKLIYEDGVWRN